MATWKVEGLYSANQLDGHENVVTSVVWACLGNNSMSGTLSLDVASDVFISYQNLTEQEVLNWVWSKLDKNGIEAAVNAPPVSAPVVAVNPLPWS